MLLIAYLLANRRKSTIVKVVGSLKLCCVELEGIAMTDVVEIAKERRARLAAEIGKLDDFVCMAEKLVENCENDAEEEHEYSPLNLIANKKP